MNTGLFVGDKQISEKHEESSMNHKVTRGALVSGYIPHLKKKTDLGCHHILNYWAANQSSDAILGQPLLWPSFWEYKVPDEREARAETGKSQTEKFNGLSQLIHQAVVDSLKKKKKEDMPNKTHSFNTFWCIPALRMISQDIPWQNWCIWTAALAKMTLFWPLSQCAYSSKLQWFKLSWFKYLINQNINI